MEERGNILMYQTVDGQTAIEVVLSNETVWLTIDKMADLFQRNKSTISRHIKNILECGELTADSVVAFFATTARDSKVYKSRYDHKRRISCELTSRCPVQDVGYICSQRVSDQGVCDE